MRGRDGIKKGGLHDPVAQSIRNEQNRDAAPSAEEVKSMHRKHLADEGCHFCGEDDPDKLTEEYPWVHNCKDRQSPRDIPPQVVCKEGHPSVRERKLQELQEKANEKGVPVVLYECNIYDVASDPDPPNSGDGPPQRWDPRNYPQPNARLYCGGKRCQSPVDQIIYPEDN